MDHNLTKTMDKETEIFNKHLCPSLLSNTDIIEEIKRTLYPPIKGLERKTRDELIQIFIMHVMPLPQRTFPNNHHGNIINEIIKKENCSSPAGKAKKIISTLQFGFSAKEQKSKQSSTHISLKNRLKPPIDLAEIHNKKICLANTPSSASDSSLEKIVIIDRLKERKNSTDADSQIQRSTDGAVETKKIILKRSNSTPKMEEDCLLSKKGRKRIDWP